jgi:hypothetical protein
MSPTPILSTASATFLMAQAEAAARKPDPPSDNAPLKSEPARFRTARQHVPPKALAAEIVAGEAGASPKARLDAAKAALAPGENRRCQLGYRPHQGAREIARRAKRMAKA